MRSIKLSVWDWPLRIFHWLLVVAVIGAYTTGKLGGSLTEWHLIMGRLTLGLIVFRLLWGFIGTQSAQFKQFFPTINRLKRYFKGEWHQLGHNPLGALSVFALLFSLMALVSTGLFANDDIAYEGPLYAIVGKTLSDELTGWHSALVNVLLGLVVLHVGAIFYYLLQKKINLIRPMLTGSKEVLIDEAFIPINQISLLRFAIAILISILVVYAVWNSEFRDYLALLAQ